VPSIKTKKCSKIIQPEKKVVLSAYYFSNHTN